MALNLDLIPNLILVHYQCHIKRGLLFLSFTLFENIYFLFKLQIFTDDIFALFSTDVAAEENYLYFNMYFAYLIILIF